MWLTLQILIIVLFPLLSIRVHRIWGWLSPVVLCYALGIFLGNISIIPLNNDLSKDLSRITVVIAIPLLLYSSNFIYAIRHSGKVILAFGLCVLSGLIATSAAAFFFIDKFEEGWKLAGMLTGIYTGGIPNMQAIGMALKASSETIVLVSASDIFVGGIYFILLISVVRPFLGLFLPDYKEDGKEVAADSLLPNSTFNWIGSLKGFLLTISILVISLGFNLLVFGNLKHTALIILLLTGLSILASLHPWVKSWDSTFETGEYFLLMFCVALGMLANFSQIIEEGGAVVSFSAVALSLTIFLHFFLSWLFKIDRDTVMISSTAAIHGPPFIGQIITVIGSRKLLLPGILTGLLGYAIGNFLGISLAYLLRYFMG